MPALAGTIFLHHLVQRGAVIHGKAVGMGVLTVKGTDGLLQLAEVGIRSVTATIRHRKPEFAGPVQGIVILQCDQVMPQWGKAVLNFDCRVTEMIVILNSSSIRERTSSVATIEYIQLASCNKTIFIGSFENNIVSFYQKF